MSLPLKPLRRKKPSGKKNLLATKGKGTMHAFLPNQPDLPCKGVVLLIVLVALVPHAVLVALVWAVAPKGEVFEHWSSFRLLSSVALTQRSFDQGEGLRAFDLIWGH